MQIYWNERKRLHKKNSKNISPPFYAISTLGAVGTQKKKGFLTKYMYIPYTYPPGPILMVRLLPERSHHWKF